MRNFSIEQLIIMNRTSSEWWVTYPIGYNDWMIGKDSAFEVLERPLLHGTTEETIIADLRSVDRKLIYYHPTFLLDDKFYYIRYDRSKGVEIMEVSLPGGVLSTTSSAVDVVTMDGFDFLVAYYDADLAKFMVAYGYEPNGAPSEYTNYRIKSYDVDTATWTSIYSANHTDVGRAYGFPGKVGDEVRFASSINGWYYYDVAVNLIDDSYTNTLLSGSDYQTTYLGYNNSPLYYATYKIYDPVAGKVKWDTSSYTGFSWMTSPIVLAEDHYVFMGDTGVRVGIMECKPDETVTIDEIPEGEDPVYLMFSPRQSVYWGDTGIYSFPKYEVV